jgi:hypothetical protein
MWGVGGGGFQRKKQEEEEEEEEETDEIIFRSADLGFSGHKTSFSFVFPLAALYYPPGLKSPCSSSAPPSPALHPLPARPLPSPRTPPPPTSPDPPASSGTGTPSPLAPGSPRSRAQPLVRSQLLTHRCRHQPVLHVVVAQTTQRSTVKCPHAPLRRRHHAVTRTTRHHHDLQKFAPQLRVCVREVRRTRGGGRLARILLHLHVQLEKPVLRGSRAGRRFGCRNHPSCVYV